jgi:hypothetical protein
MKQYERIMKHNVKFGTNRYENIPELECTRLRYYSSFHIRLTVNKINETS